MPGGSSLRPLIHRMRGVTIGKNVFIGDDVYLENCYPEQIEIHDGVQIGVRNIIIAHRGGAGKVIIEKHAFIGPGSIICAIPGQTLTIGEGAVVGAACVISTSVPPFVFLRNPPPTKVATVSTPLAATKDFFEFIRGLTPVPEKKVSNLGQEIGKG